MSLSIYICRYFLKYLYDTRHKNHILYSTLDKRVYLAHICYAFSSNNLKNDLKK